MMLEASSCERPSKSSARVFLPSSVSNTYSFSTSTQGSSSRFFLISSFRSACSPSSFASSSRAACHSSRVPTLCSGIFSSPLLELGSNLDSGRGANSSRTIAAVRELARGLWHWDAPHPDWTTEDWWPQRVSSYAIDDGTRLLLFDPLAVPS